PDIKERRPELPVALRSVVVRALSRDPAGRFATALEMAQAVRSAVAIAGGPATPAELAAYGKADFADDLAAQDELVASAGGPPRPPAPPPAPPPPPPPAGAPRGHPAL